MTCDSSLAKLLLFGVSETAPLSQLSQNMARLIGNGAIGDDTVKDDLIRRGEMTPFDTIIINELLVSAVIVVLTRDVTVILSY